MILEDEEAQRGQQVLHLSEAEVMEITHFERGNGLISSNNNNITVEIKASPLERDLITTDRRALLDLLRRMTNENSVSSTDNGVTQTVDARQGVALSAKVEVKPRVLLRPFRTFLEVEQPESEFLLRVDAEKGIGLFEADGGIWKLEAKRNIAEYFAKAMGDLIESSKVVVMQ